MLYIIVTNNSKCSIFIYSSVKKTVNQVCKEEVRKMDTERKRKWRRFTMLRIIINKHVFLPPYSNQIEMEIESPITF